MTDKLYIAVYDGDISLPATSVAEAYDAISGVTSAPLADVDFYELTLITVSLVVDDVK